MAERVRFINISQEQYDNLANKSEYLFYRCTDTQRLFIGEHELTNDEDLDLNWGNFPNADNNKG